MRLRSSYFAVPAAAAALAAVALIPGASADDEVSAAATNPEASLGAVLLGTNEVPGPGAALPAAGAASVTINAATGQVCVVLETDGLNEELAAAHIHRGDETEAGPVVINFAVASGDGAAKCVAADVAIAAEVATTPSEFYVNVHTVSFPDGALRGQLESTGPAAGALVLLPEPTRVYDSRDQGETPLAVDTTRTVDLTMSHTGGAMTMVVPPGAKAALITMTVTGTGASANGGGGFATVFSNALIGNPATSTINWTSAGQDIATTTTVAVDGSGKVKVLAGGAATDVIVDVIGYYTLVPSAST